MKKNRVNTIIITIFILVSSGFCKLGLAKESEPLYKPDKFEVKRTIPEKYKKGMYVIMTGTGIPQSVQGEGGASVAVLIDGRLLQFDMGMKSVEHLIKAGIHPNSVDFLFFTHLHVDHISDFPDYLFRYGNRDSFKVFGPRGTKSMINGAESFMELHLHDQALSVDSTSKFLEKHTGKAMKGADIYRGHIIIEEIAEAGVVLDGGDFKVTAAATPHVIVSPGVHSFAYRIDSDYGSVVISGDTAPSINIIELAKNTDLLVHEAMRHDPEMYPEPWYEERVYKLEEGLRGEVTHKGVGHTTPTELGKIAQKTLSSVH